MFTAEHFIWLAICAAFIAVMTAVSVKKNFGLKLAGGIMVGFCIVSETGKVMSNMLESVKGGMHLDPLCLPFHLCSLCGLLHNLRQGRKAKADVHKLSVGNGYRRKLFRTAYPDQWSGFS